MDIKIVATKNCSHCADLQHELRGIGISFELLYVENHPDFAQAHGIRHSPNLLVNDEVIFRGQPTPHELRAYSSNAYAKDNPTLQSSRCGTSVEQRLGVPPLPYHDLPTQSSTALIPAIKVFRQNCYYHLSGIPSNSLGFLLPIYFLAVPILCSSQVYVTRLHALKPSGQSLRRSSCYAIQERLVVQIARGRIKVLWRLSKSDMPAVKLTNRNFRRKCASSVVS